MDTALSYVEFPARFNTFLPICHSIWHGTSLDGNKLQEKEKSMDFQRDVIQRSQEIPVLVDFWAPWCGPCRILGPVIESLAIEQKGQWELVKLNTEEYPDIATRYQVRSIPNVKLFYKGDVIGEFVGALSKTAIETWLSNHLPDEHKMGLDAILSQRSSWPDPELIPQLEAFLKAHPDHKEAGIELAKEQILDKPSQSLEMISDLQHDETVEDLKSLGELLLLRENGKEGVPASLLDASESLFAKDFKGAVESIIETVKVDKSVHNELPRRAGVAVFRMLGPQHPVAKEYRRLFDMMLD